jgi:hypothetical protein
MNQRYEKIKESRISGYIIKVGKPFMNFGMTGAIIKESKIIAARNDDGGFDEVYKPIPQMNKDEIKNVIEEIDGSNLRQHYTELLFNEAEVHGIYYIKDLDIRDYMEADVRITQEKFNIEKVYEICHKTGGIILVKWDGKNYINGEPISTREELFNS